MSGCGVPNGSMVTSSSAPNEPPAAVATDSASVRAFATAFCNASRRAASVFDAKRLSRSEIRRAGGEHRVDHLADRIDVAHLDLHRVVRAIARHTRTLARRLRVLGEHVVADRADLRRGDARRLHGVDHARLLLRVLGPRGRRGLALRFDGDADHRAVRVTRVSPTALVEMLGGGCGGGFCPGCAITRHTG